MALKIIPIGLARIFPAPCSPTSQGSVWSTPLAEFKCKYLEKWKSSSDQDLPEIT